MSDKDTQILNAEDGQMLTAEYKDGQLQIVEVSPFDKDNETHVLSDLSSADETRYVQVMDSEKGIVHLDLLSLIKCSTSSDDTTYQVIGTAEDGDTTFTCVLEDEAETESPHQESYVVVEEEGAGKEPLVYLHSSLQQVRAQQRLRDQGKETKPLTSEELMAKARLLERAKSLNLTPSSRAGRKRKSDLPPPMELLTSPAFKLYLYSCKLCSYKCNAMPDMSKHRATAHNSKKGGSVRGAAVYFQCAKCPFRAYTQRQLIIHNSSRHSTVQEESDAQEESILDTTDDDGSAVEVLVCGACGFEASSRDVFRDHVQCAHSLTLADPLTTITLEEENVQTDDS